MSQPFGKPVHRAHRIIGGHFDHGVLGVWLFQHVSGNSDPVSAL
jgi:hypothetical protein